MTPRSSFKRALRPASMPRTLTTSIMSLLTVRVKSTSGCVITSCRLTPSVSKTHSVSVTNSPVSSTNCVFFASRRKTLRILSIPCSATRLRRLPSTRLMNASCSSSPTSPPGPPYRPMPSPVFEIGSSLTTRIRKINFSALSSLNRQ